jgi:cell division protein ZapA
MAQVTIRINGFTYPVSCEDGQEQHLTDMAAEVDRRITSIKSLGNQTGESRLLVLAALLLADELHDTKTALTAAESATPAAAKPEADGTERRARLRPADPRAEESDMLLDTALRAATALAQLLQARHGFTTAETAVQRDATTAALINAGEQLRQAAEEIDAFFKLAEAAWAAGRRGRDALN